jgi:predicted AlkP superfamily pyrophosphatase or phosphodiesterase
MLKRFNLLVIAMMMIASSFAQDTTQQIISGRKNSAEQMKKPYVIMISIDGMRTDFTELHQASFLQKASKEGVRAKYMIPSFPSLTFPNHYAIATGQYPSHNGLVDNTYFDKATGVQYSMSNVKLVTNPKYYGGTPIWVLAEKQQMVSASYFWVGSEAPIEGYLPSYYYNYNEKTNIATRIQAIKDWLTLPEEKRPHLITVYFPEVDHDAHSFGTKDNRVTKAVQFVDSAINAIQESLASLHLPINYIVVSDHGMTDVDNLNTMGLPKQIDTAAFRVPWGDALLHLYAKDSTKINSTVEALKKDTSFNTYTLNETPAYWHYAKKDDRFDRLGDIIITPKLPKVFNLGTRKTTPGKHGFDNHHPDMRATFIAWGPAFKNGITIEGFENVNVYPLVAHILGLQLDETKIDGRLKVLAPILKNK